MAEDIIRNSSGAGYGAKKAEALSPHLPAVPSVPPMEAEWLRVVGGRPGGVGDSRGPNDAGHNGAGPNGAAPKGPGSNGRGPKD